MRIAYRNICSNCSSEVSYPGGCEIGPRPIDLHLKALRNMGVKINDAQRGFIYAEVDKLKGCEIQLDYPSVGATENIMMAGIAAEGETIIRNAAREPEIVDLQKYLVGIGANVQGAGSSVIRIKGSNKPFGDIDHTVIPDRIVAGTYMIAAGITGGDILLNNVVPEHIIPIIYNMKECGCKVISKDNTLRVIGPARPRSIDSVRTLPYPGFPTDMQAQLVAMLTVARGTSIVVETVFESRYKHVEELLRMGANIKLEGRLAVIKGVKKLVGASVCAKDLRGGAALVLAGLAADGQTIVNDIKHIDRGYEKLEEKLSQVGALIVRGD